MRKLHFIGTLVVILIFIGSLSFAQEETQTFLLRGGKSATVISGGMIYNITLVGAQFNVAFINVTLAQGQILDQKSISKGSADKVGGLNIYVDDITQYSTTDQTQNSVKLVVKVLTAKYTTPKVTPTLSVSGVLTNSTSQLLTGRFTATFSIWDASSGGNMLWTSEPITISVANGIFQATLSPPLNFDRDYWLETNISGETLTPRQKLLTVPSAVFANVAGRVGSLASKSACEGSPLNCESFLSESACSFQIGCEWDLPVFTLYGEQSIAVIVDNSNYDITLISTPGSAAEIKVGTATETISKGSSKLVGGLNISIKDVFQISTTDQTQNSVKFSITNLTTKTCGGVPSLCSSFTSEILCNNQQGCNWKDFVGIGTDSPSEKLEVNGSAKVSDNIFISSIGRIGAISAIDTPGIIRQLNGIDTLDFLKIIPGAIVTNSKLAIGLNSPTVNLHVNGSGFIKKLFIAPHLDSPSIPDVTYGEVLDIRGGSIYVDGSFIGTQTLPGISQSISIFDLVKSGHAGLGVASGSLFDSPILWMWDNPGNRFEVRKRDANDRFGKTLFLVTSDGNVGIGTSSPGTNKLMIQGSTSDTTAAALNIVNAASSNLLYVRNDGNVGIGTNTPAAKLTVRNADIANPSGQETLRIMGDYNSNIPGSGPLIRFTDLFENPRGSVRSVQESLPTTAGLSFNVFEAIEKERVRILSNGNVGIGTSNPNAKLEVSGDIKLGADSNADVRLFTTSGQPAFSGCNEVCNNAGAACVAAFDASSSPNPAIPCATNAQIVLCLCASSP